jgi:long-subunit fatty acid transport protein
VGSGARALGMGGAFLARPDDATAASWNPAGLSYLRATEVSVVGAYTEQHSVTALNTINRVEDTEGSAPDFLSVSVPVSIGSASGSVQLSYQRVVPYSFTRTTDEVGQVESGENQRKFVVDTSGGFDVVALSTGFKLGPDVRVGVSLNRWFNGFTQHRERQLTRRPSVQDGDFSISGWSANVGLILHPFESVNLGVVAKTSTDASVHLTRSRADVIVLPGQPEVVTRNAYSSDDVRLKLPGAVGFGASWRPTNRLTLSGDYTLTFWSGSHIQNYFFLPATAEDAAVPPPPVFFEEIPFPDVLGNAQSDTKELRLGVEYVLIAGRVKLPLRAGYVREKQYLLLSDGTVPILEGVTGGAGIVLGDVLLDAAYVYQWGGYGTDEVRSTQRLHRLLVSVIYRRGS